MAQEHGLLKACVILMLFQEQKSPVVKPGFD
jgi:hypothetical protein